MSSSGHSPAGRFTQLFPPKPGFTEKDLPDLSGKVYIVTGANSGIGKELSQILYAKKAKVYMAGRSEKKTMDAIRDIKNSVSPDIGELVFLHLDLANLATIKASTEQFLAHENRLHVLFNNAGVMNPPEGSKSEQGYELQLGVNCLGTFLFTKLLTPTLIETAKLETPGAVRVVWASSTAIESPSALREGIDMENLDYHRNVPIMTKYSISKTGDMFYGTEYARRHNADGIISVPLNPGLVDSDLWRTQGRISHALFRTFLLHPPVLGAYTELFGGLSPEITLEKSGQWVIPWGRFQSLRKDLVAGTRSASEPGGTGIAERFWDWSEEQIRSFL
ncbi:NAD(P)-binding protein [Hypoxylon crocopeplum]|nr:NAD(P)-binding protein [Hypoxylon crocopeplum]